MSGGDRPRRCSKVEAEAIEPEEFFGGGGDGRTMSEGGGNGRASRGDMPSN